MAFERAAKSWCTQGSGDRIVGWPAVRTGRSPGMSLRCAMKRPRSTGGDGEKIKSFSNGAHMRHRMGVMRRIHVRTVAMDARSGTVLAP